VKHVLVDTHAFLWFVFDDPRLSSEAAQVIENPSVSKLVSVASLWEITIKRQLDKLSLGMDLADFFARFVRGADLDVVPIELPHLLAYAELPLRHRDPFDRVIIAQANVLAVPLVTSDLVFRDYSVDSIW
jgi:PIN domain nuclease of toxin-antitoxin system